MIDRCLKQIDGSCGDCPALDRSKRLIRLGVKYQEAMAHIAATECPPGLSPTVEVQLNKGSGAVSGVLIEGKEVYI